MKDKVPNSPKTILVTGGLGFIGSNFIRSCLNKYSDKVEIINLDLISYAANPNSLDDIKDSQRYAFYKGSILDQNLLNNIFKSHKIDTVVHFAAESHVDRSIHGPSAFVQTNIVGTHNLLEVCRAHWSSFEDKRFHHVSTDEVYGELKDKVSSFKETTPYDPRSPYSASKAASDHLVRSYFHTYGLPVTISNCCNNYGPYQNPEKLIPMVIDSLIKKRSIPVYGEGTNIRDWIHVDEHNYYLWEILCKGVLGETYNIGTNNEHKNIDLIKMLIRLYCEVTKEDSKGHLNLITYVADRLGHDFRYSIDNSKLLSNFGSSFKIDFEKGLLDTINWYLNNQQWVKKLKD